MQGNAEQATLRSIVDGEVQRRAVQSAIDDALNFACGPLQHKKIVCTEERKTGRLIKSGNYGAHGEVVVQHAWRCRGWLNQSRNTCRVVSRIKIAFAGTDC